MNLPDAAAEFARALVAGLSGETGRDQRQHAAEQRVWREDVEHSAARAEREQQLRLNAERELAELRELYDAERMQRKEAERRYKETAERQIAELRADSVELGNVRRQLRVLRARVEDVLDNDGDLLDETRRTRLARAYRWSESPAGTAAASEGAARRRAECDRDDLLHAVRGVVRKWSSWAPEARRELDERWPHFSSGLATLAEVAGRIERQSESPAEGAARLRVE